MNVIYAGIALQICHFNDFQQNSVKSADDTDYLFTHFVVDVTCVWNRAATASLNGLVQQPPPGVFGDRPAVSLSTLRDTLMQERQHLTVLVGDDIILESPPTFVEPMATPCDANNGPHPISCDVTSFHGIKTAIVRFRVETWLNEFSPAQSVLLSNRWASSENILEDFRKIIHVEGVAVFRQDTLQVNIAASANINSADAYRDLVVPPPRNGFQRKNLRVGLDSDGTRLYWSFDDEQPEGNYQLGTASGIWKAEGYTFVETDWTGGKFGVPGLRLPDAVFGIHAEVWGRPQVTRRQLGNALTQIIASAGFRPGDRVGLGTRLQIDFPRRHASASMSVAFSGLGGGGFVVTRVPALDTLPQLRIFQDFDAPGVWVQGVGPQPIIRPGPDGIHGDPIPGSTVVELMAARLLAPNTRPNVPVVNLGGV